MKKRLVKRLGSMSLAVLLAAMVWGCGQQEEAADDSITVEEASTIEAVNTAEESDAEDVTPDVQPDSQVSELEVRFGDNGEAFRMQLEENETAKAIANYVGTSDWRLPIYEREGEADYDVMQYYDMSNRYEIPSNPETVTAERAGEVYYSHPNRIVLFYQDAQIEGEYTKIGTFDATEEFVKAVEENPVLEGWGNKIVQITTP